MSETVVIDVEAKFIDKVSSKVKKADKELNKLIRKKVIGKIEADNTKLIQKTNESEKKMNKLSKSKFLAKLDAQDKVSSKILKALDKGKNFSSKKFKALLEINDSKAFQQMNKLEQGLRKITSKTWQGNVKITDYATRPIRTIYQALFNLKTLMGAIMAGFAINEAVIKPVSLADQYVSAQIGFTTSLGENNANQLMDSIDSFAKKTPFKTSNIITNAQKMLAMGWDSKNIIDDLEIIGDAASATGKGDEGLNSIILALSQIKTLGRLGTEELNQLAEAGISAKKYIAKGLGFGEDDAGIAKASKVIESGAIGSAEALGYLLEGMKKYQGMMDKVSEKTASGIWSNIQDTFEINVLRRWGQGLQEGVIFGLSSLVELFDKSDGSLQRLGDTLQEVGKKVSMYFGEKVKTSVEKTLEIMDSFEFQQASFGGKTKILWDEIITRPFSDWWEKGGREKFLNTGKEIGSSLVKGILKEVKMAWEELPLWGKLLLGGYGASKTLSGIGNLVGAIGNIGGLLGKGFSGNVVNRLALTGMSLGAGNLAGGASMSTLGLATIGGASVLGGVTAVASTIKGISDLYKAYKITDLTEQKAYSVKGGMTLGGVGTGALIGGSIGALFGGIGAVPGALIGAGIGGLAGIWSGDKLANSIRSAKYDSEEMQEAIKDSSLSAENLNKTLEKAAFKNLKNHFGDMSLSMSEIERLSNQIVFGDKLKSFEDFANATEISEANLTSIENTAKSLDKWNFRASLGVKFDNDERLGIDSSIKEYISLAEEYVKNKHYEFNLAIKLLMGEEENITENSNPYFLGLEEKIRDLGSKLSSKVNIALEDGVITLNEQEEIINLQNQIANIINKLAQYENDAESNLLKIKFGKTKIDANSYQSLHEQNLNQVNGGIENLDKSYTTAFVGLKMQMDEADTEEAKSKIQKQMDELESNYQISLNTLKANAMDVELEIVGDSYSKELGKGAKEKLQKALEGSLKDGLEPVDWTMEDALKYLNVEELSGETFENLKNILQGISELDIPIKINPELTLSEEENEVKSVLEGSGFNEPITLEQEITYNPTLKYSPISKLPPSVLNFPTSVEQKVNVIYNPINEYLPKPVFGETTGETKVDNVYKDKNEYKPSSVTATVNGTIYVNNKYVERNPYSSGNVVIDHLLNNNGFATGGFISSKTLSWLGEEGTPEMVIPLGSHRRQRGIELWEKAGNILGVSKQANGSIVGGCVANSNVSLNKEGSINLSSGVSGNIIKVEIGGINLDISTDGGQSVIEVIKNQKEAIANEIAGVINEALASQFSNTPKRSA